MPALVLPSPVRRAFTPLTALAALAPALALAFFYLYVVRARLALGEWPAPYRPDPKDLGFDVHMVLVLVALVLAVASPPFFGGVLVLRRLTLGTWERALRWSLVFVLAYVGFLCITRTDPGGFFEWLMD